MKENDSKILELKKQIEEKKSKIDKSSRFAPITTCSIELDGVRYNINTFTKELIVIMLVKLNSYAMSAKELNLLKECNISGFNVQDWIADLKSKLDFMCRKEEETKLKTMEAKLDQLLSDEKKTEMELDEIASMLK